MTTTSNPPTLRVGFLVFPDFEPIDVWGPVEAFSIARFIGTGYTDTPRPFEIVFVSNELSGASSPAYETLRSTGTASEQAAAAIRIAPSGNAR